MQRPDTARLSHRPNAGDAPPTTRPVYFLQTQSVLEATVYDRYTLPVGYTGQGPAVIEEYGSTTIVGPQDTFVIGTLGEIRIACSKTACLE
jgi:N-methylhydantoinase A